MVIFSIIVNTKVLFVPKLRRSKKSYNLLESVKTTTRGDSFMNKYNIDLNFIEYNNYNEIEFLTSKHVSDNNIKWIVSKNRY